MCADAIERTHGGLARDELLRLGIEPDAVLDFSASCNPFGPSPALNDALLRARIDRYPDPRALAACRALADQLDVGSDRIVLGNGAADLLWTLARVLLAPGETLCVADPTFSEIVLAALQVGARVERVTASESTGFAHELGALFDRADRCGCVVLYLCAPSSPVGAPVELRELASFARARPALHVIVDESYLSLSERFAELALLLPANVIRVRSLTKEQGIPGVRVGYALAAPDVVAALEVARPAWTTGAHAQAAAIAATTAPEFVAHSRTRLLALRRQLEHGLRGLGLAPIASSANFVCTRVPDAARLREALLVRQRVLVRDCASFGMDNFVRIAARPEPELARLLTALGEELERCSREP